jgi:predicted GNAT family N-acyltransferase
MPTAFSVTIIHWDAARERALRVRETVFVREQGVPPEIEIDEWDAASDHALACTTDREVIGTGRLLPDGHIGRMAVLAEWRGKGVGSALLDALVERARARGIAEVALNAQVHAVPFYRRHGFVEAGEPFMEAGIPHVAMTRRLD